ncbi:hypothetical protein GCM10027203_32920 [Nonomuraea fastidiosa]
MSKRTLGHVPDYRNLIGGELVPAPRTMETVNPATGEPWARIPASGPAEAAAAAEAASRAFPSWSALPALARAHYLRKVSELFGRHAEELARLETRDNGRILRDTLTKDLPGMAHLWQIAAGQCLDAVKGDTVQLGPDALGLTRCEPYGVAVCIIPWNSPISTFSAKAAYALAAGNTVVVKPAEQASASVLRIGELLAEVLPPGVLNIVSGLGEEVGDPLDLATTMGPIVSAGQYERVTSYWSRPGRRAPGWSSAAGPGPRWCLSCPAATGWRPRCIRPRTTGCGCARRRSSVRSRWPSRSRPMTRPWPSPTTPATAWRPACGRATCGGRTGSSGTCGPARSG